MIGFQFKFSPFYNWDAGYLNSILIGSYNYEIWLAPITKQGRTSITHCFAWNEL